MKMYGVDKLKCEFYKTKSEDIVTLLNEHKILPIFKWNGVYTYVKSKELIQIIKDKEVII